MAVVLRDLLPDQLHLRITSGCCVEYADHRFAAQFGSTVHSFFVTNVQPFDQQRQVVPPETEAKDGFSAVEAFLHCGASEADDLPADEYRVTV